jgi:hypothetical protein
MSTFRPVKLSESDIATALPKLAGAMAELASRQPRK